MVQGLIRVAGRRKKLGRRKQDVDWQNRGQLGEGRAKRGAEEQSRGNFTREKLDEGRSKRGAESRSRGNFTRKSLGEGRKKREAELRSPWDVVNQKLRDRRKEQELERQRGANVAPQKRGTKQGSGRNATGKQRNTSRKLPRRRRRNFTDSMNLLDGNYSRHQVSVQMMNEIGYEDCDWVGQEKKWPYWKRFLSEILGNTCEF